MFHHFFFGQTEETAAAVTTVLELTQSMDAGYIGDAAVLGQVNLANADADLLAADIGYMGDSFVIWSNLD